MLASVGIFSLGQLSISFDGPERANANAPSGMCACYVPLAPLPVRPRPRVRVRRTKKEDSHMQLDSHARSLARTAKIYGRHRR